MDDATKAATLSAVRSVLLAVGSALAARGYLDSAAVNEIAGAIMVIGPAAWGIASKFTADRKAKEREAIALNAGIRHADATAGPTPSVPPDQVRTVIAQMGPVANG